MAKHRLIVAVLGLVAGCRSVQLDPPRVGMTKPVEPGYHAPTTTPHREIVQVAHESAPVTDALDLPGLLRLALERNPRLAQASWAVQAAQGRALQAGLYPNPTLNITADELGDRTGQVGIWGAPFVNQEIVTYNKLGLSKAVVCKEVDQATLAVIAERFRMMAEVQSQYWDLVATEQRIAALEDLQTRMKQSLEMVSKLEKAGEVGHIAVVQLEIDLERDSTELLSAKSTLPAMRQKLAASIGVPVQELPAIRGNYDTPVPGYDLDAVRTEVLANHPDARSAQVGIEKAKLTLQRAEVESKPNVTLSAGYTYQGQNRSNDVSVAAALPVPLWNKNQGNIGAARAQLASAYSEVERVQNDLAARVAVAYTAYSTAATRADRYRRLIVPKADEAFQLALKGRQLGQLDYIKVLEAQRSAAEARLELARAEGDVRRAAAELNGLLLLDPVAQSN